MHALVYIVFAASFTAATAWGMGALLFRLLGIALRRGEQKLLEFVTGSACLSAIVFLLCTLKLARKGVFLAVGIIVLTWAFRIGAHRSTGDRSTALPFVWKWFTSIVLAIFTGLYILHAAAPEMSPDGMAYHLAIVAKFARSHGFERITTNMYANLSEGIELLFLFAFPMGRHPAAALLHLTFLMALALMIFSYGRRIGRPVAGAAAAIFVYASPVIGRDATVAYIDVAVGAVFFALFYALQIWNEERSPALLVPIGILAGFSYAAKYTAFVAVPYAVGFVIWKCWRTRQPILRPLFILGALVVLFTAPWMVKNYLWVANPISPFGNRIFPNRYVHVSLEEDYRRNLQTYGLKDRRTIPLEITIRGDALGGFFGPLFLLTPLGLLALRFREGRQIWLAAVVAAIPYFGNIGTRFLIPAIPFFSLVIALALANAPWLLMLLCVAHAVLSWPSVAGRYCQQYAWRLNDVPMRAVLRKDSDDRYLLPNSEYAVARFVEKVVPPNALVFSYPQIAEAYCKRNILMSYGSASSETMTDILWIPRIPDYQPTRRVTFTFPERPLQDIRVVQTARGASSQWNISELRVFDRGVELPRASAWRVRAHPNPWDAQFMFDNNPATRWRSWQKAEPGMFVEVNFGSTQTIDSISVDTSGDNAEEKMKLEVYDGKWRTLADNSTDTSVKLTGNLRRAAMSALKARGVSYFIVGNSDYKAEDFRDNAKLWGIHFMGERGHYWLYSID